MGKLISMFCSRTEYEVEAKLNAKALQHNGFKIGFCPDWRTNSSGKPVYFSNIIKYYREVVELHGGKLIILSFDCKPEQFKDAIDGWIIPGGRDVDPRFYGQKNTDSKFDAGDAEKRWNFCKAFLERSHPDMPVLGICYGFEVLNCLMGGDLFQHLKNPHYETRRVKVKPESRLAKATGVSQMNTVCYHHQGIKTLAPCFEATSWDLEHDDQIHSYEYVGKDGRNILGVLWHPESCYEGEPISNHDKNNLAIFAHFFRECKQYYEKKASVI